MNARYSPDLMAAFAKAAADLAERPEDSLTRLTFLDLLGHVFDGDFSADEEAERENITRYGIDRDGYRLDWMGYPKGDRVFVSWKERTARRVAA